MTKPPSISRRTMLAVGGVLISGMLSPGVLYAQGTSTLERIKKAGVLVIGNGGAFPPFEFVADGQLTGFDRDLGDELCRRMGVKADWVVSDFGGLIPGLTSGRVDIVLSALTRTEDRAKRIAFSTPYYTSGIAAAYRGALTIVNPDDMIGKIVGVQTGTAGEKYVRDKYADKVKEIKNYPEFPLAMRDLEIGRTELVVNNLPTLRYNISNEHRSDLKVTGVWDALDIGINTRLMDQDLLAEINRHVIEMKDDGFLKRNDAKWFGA